MTQLTSVRANVAAGRDGGATLLRELAQSMALGFGRRIMQIQTTFMGLTND